MLKKPPQTQSKPTKSKKRIALEWAAQLAVFAVVLMGVTAWQTRNMVGNGEDAPMLSLRTLDGNSVSLSDFKGKPVAIYFFAPWCSVCHASSHNINALREAYGEDELAVVAVGLGYETVDELKSFANKHALKVPVLVGDEQVSSTYKIAAFPSIYILNKDHRISHALSGYTTEIGLRGRVAITVL